MNAAGKRAVARVASPGSDSRRGSLSPRRGEPFTRWGYRFEAGQIPCKDCKGSGSATFRTFNYTPVPSGVCSRCHGRGHLGPHRCPGACDLPLDGA